MNDPIDFVLGSFEGASIDGATADRLADGMPGVTLFREPNVENEDQVVDLCAQIHRQSGDLPALIAVDQEGGQLQALSGIVTDFPGNMALAACRDIDLAERVGAAIGHELRALGITVNYAPVCDLLTMPTNHGLSIRSYGDDPTDAADLAVAQIVGLQSAGVAATAKHFPGKGAATVDTHYATAVIARTRAEFDAYELVPFRAAIRADVRMMMTSHAICPALSPGNERPATLSPEILTAMLREELGFTGVTVTDALDMAAVGAADQADATESLDAIRAGSDLLLTTPQMAIDALWSGLRSANELTPIDSAALAMSKDRVRRLREWLSRAPVPDPSVVGSATHRTLADEVARRSITEVSVESPHGPVDRDCVVIQPTLENLTPADTTTAAGASLAVELGVLGLSPAEHIVGHAPTTSEIDRVVSASADREAIVLVTAAATEPGQIELVRRVAAHASRCTVIVARNPLDLGFLEVPAHGRILCSYGLTSSTIRALGAVLTTPGRPPGVLPVSRASHDDVR